MTDPRSTIEGLASLMDEFMLTEASLKLGELQITFRRGDHATTLDANEAESETDFQVEESVPLSSAVPSGHPITSPMNGIYYAQPSPSSPPFVEVGHEVHAGQIVAIIEAMKVMNEVHATVSGRVTEVSVKDAQVVNVGDVLLRVG